MRADGRQVRWSPLKALLSMAAFTVCIVYLTSRTRTKDAASATERAHLDSESTYNKQHVLKPGSESPFRGYKQRIVAVGDVHGDFSALTSILRRSNLIDLRNNWIGGKDIFVQTGDNVDRGPSLIAITRLYDSLRTQARQAGGDVVSLLGNHEFMNTMLDWRYVTKDDIATFGDAQRRRVAITSGWIGQTWRANYSVTARVPYTTHMRGTGSGDDGSSSMSHAAAHFVHGGVTPEYLDSLDQYRYHTTPVERINAIGLSVMEAYSDPKLDPAKATSQLTPIQREFWSERGPMWNREYALDEDEVAICERARRAADRLKVRRLVMGHTPHFEGVQSRCDGLIILIDTGISRAYGGAHSSLEINYALDSLEDDESSWNETETVTALYTDGRASELLAKTLRTIKLA
ncbi:hypothetical protein ACM66B_001905 [Microbotryomycetes sp. NB124-2]